MGTFDMLFGLSRRVHIPIFSFLLIFSYLSPIFTGLKLPLLSLLLVTLFGPPKCHKQVWLQSEQSSNM